MNASHPTFGTYFRAAKEARKGRPMDFGPRHMRLIAAVLKAAQLGIADDPAEARMALGEVFARLTRCYLDAGLTNPDDAIRPLRWQHRPAEPDNSAWLHARARLVSHAELLAGLCASTMQGTTKTDAIIRPLLSRYECMTDDLITLCGGLKLSPRECAESAT